MAKYRINGPLIKKLRLSFGVSQLQMSIDCDLQTGIISKLECGLTTNPSAETVRKIALYFGMVMDDFMIEE